MQGLSFAFGFVAQEVPFHHKGQTKDHLQSGQAQFTPFFLSLYWVMPMSQVFHLPYNIAIRCDHLVVAVEGSPFARVFDPT